MVLIPPASARRHPVDLLLCGHHYVSSRAALAAAGAVVMDETGAIVDPAPVSNENCAPLHHTPGRRAVTLFNGDRWPPDSRSGC